MNTRALERGLEALEKVLKPSRCGGGFIMANSCAEADHEIERLKAEFGDDMDGTFFVMILNQPQMER